MGSAAAQTTGLLSQDTGISEDGDATLNSDTPQLGRQQCRRVGRSAPMSPLENTAYHPAFLGWGNWGEEGACFRPGSEVGAERGPNPGQGGPPLSSALGPRDRDRVCLQVEGAPGVTRGRSPTPQVRQPRGSQTRPPSGEAASAHRCRDGGPRPPPGVATGRDCPGHLHHLEDVVRLPVLGHFRGDAVRGGGRVHATARLAAPW